MLYSIQYNIFYKFYKQILIDNNLSRVKYECEYFLKDVPDLFKVPLKFIHLGSSGAGVKLVDTYVYTKSGSILQFNIKWIKNKKYIGGELTYDYPIYSSQKVCNILNMYNDLF